LGESEVGRRLAVVASEMRALAQHSAQAAKAIKALIFESVGQIDAGAASWRSSSGRSASTPHERQPATRREATETASSFARRTGAAALATKGRLTTR